MPPKRSSSPKEREGKRMRSEKKWETMSLAKKIEMLDELCVGAQVNAVGREYDVNESMICTIRKCEDSIRVCYGCRKHFILRNVKFTEESASADHQAAELFPAELAKNIEDNDYKPKKAFHDDETGLLVEMHETTDNESKDKDKEQKEQKFLAVYLRENLQIIEKVISNLMEKDPNMHGGPNMQTRY
ncbi:unnamed protein product [Caretta caretta]